MGSFFVQMQECGVFDGSLGVYIEDMLLGVRAGPKLKTKRNRYFGIIVVSTRYATIMLDV